MDLMTLAATKVRELALIFYEAGSARDFGKVRGYGGNAQAALRDIRRRNDELEALVDEIERTPDAKTLRALFGNEPDDREVLGDYHRIHVPRVKLSPIGGGW